MKNVMNINLIINLVMISKNTIFANRMFLIFMIIQNKMKYTIVVTLFVYSVLGMAQSPVYQSKKYPNGNLVYEGYFVNGTPVGQLKRYHENGKLKSLQIFGTKDSVSVEYYKGDGKLFAKGLFLGAKRAGTWKYYADKGYVFMVENYENGLREGEALIYSENNTVLERRNYKNDLLHGPRIQYYPYGNVLAKYSYENGKLEGPYKSYYETGDLDQDGKYVNDKKEGVWKTYKDDGLYVKVEYKDGVAINQKELDKKLQDQMDENEKKDKNIKDPGDYLTNPDGYFSNSNSNAKGSEE